MLLEECESNSPPSAGPLLSSNTTIFVMFGQLLVAPTVLPDGVIFDWMFLRITPLFVSAIRLNANKSLSIVSSSVLTWALRPPTFFIDCLAASKPASTSSICFKTLAWRGCLLLAVNYYFLSLSSSTFTSDLVWSKSCLKSFMAVRLFSSF